MSLPLPAASPHPKALSAFSDQSTCLHFPSSTPFLCSLSHTELKQDVRAAVPQPAPGTACRGRVGLCCKPRWPPHHKPQPGKHPLVHVTWERPPGKVRNSGVHPLSNLQVPRLRPSQCSSPARACSSGDGLTLPSRPLWLGRKKSATNSQPGAPPGSVSARD